MILIRIRRRENADAKPYWQSFFIRMRGIKFGTVAHALEMLNERIPLLDSEGNKAEPIAWNYGCLQELCGACAMRINGRPRLACTTFLEEAVDPFGVITLEPLTKFPVVRDLAIDRSLLAENLINNGITLQGDAKVESVVDEKLLDISKCLMCGCCYEVCPNCFPGGTFMGPSAMHNSYRILRQESDQAHLKATKKAAVKKGKGQCSKALSCQEICPIGIPMTKTLVYLK